MTLPRPSPLFALLAAALAGTLWAPVTVHAQAGERAATAEDLFRQALRLTREHRFADACPRFAESHRLDPAFGALMNLAACYEKLGRTASAWQAYVDAVELARDKGQRARADSARKKAAQLAPRLVRLEIRLGPGVEASGLAITRNGKLVDPALLGHAVPVDPGSHDIVASRDGAEPWKTSVRAAEPGKTAVVELRGPLGAARPAAPEPDPAPVDTAAPAADAPRSAPAPAPMGTTTPAAGAPRSAPASAPVGTAAPAARAPAARRTEPPVHTPSLAVVRAPAHDIDAAGARDRSLRITGIAVATGGAALAATGGVFAWLSRSISDDYTHVTTGERFDPAREHRARTYQTSAFVLWGAGAAAIAGGATLYVLGRHRTDGAALSLLPVPLHAGAAAMVSGRW